MTLVATAVDSMDDAGIGPFDCLKPHHVYRIGYNVQNAKLRGKAAVFFGWKEASRGDIRRARVDVDGTEYLVNASIIISL